MKKYELNQNDVSLIEYTIKNDVLKRRDKLVNLARYLNLIDENYIISIDGKWGCGKSIFVKQLEYIIENDCTALFNKADIDIITKLREIYIPFYYNAWANDNHEDIIESLILSIINEYPKFKNYMIINEYSS